MPQPRFHAYAGRPARTGGMHTDCLAVRVVLRRRFRATTLFLLVHYAWCVQHQKQQHCTAICGCNAALLASIP